jgi:hypothetical protein
MPGRVAGGTGLAAAATATAREFPLLLLEKMSELG